MLKDATIRVLPAYYLQPLVVLMYSRPLIQTIANTFSNRLLGRRAMTVLRLLLWTFRLLNFHPS